MEAAREDGFWRKVALWGGNSMPAERDRRRKLSHAVQPAWDEAVTAYLASCRSANLSPSYLGRIREVLLGGRTRDFLAEHPIEHVGQIDRDLLRAMQLAMFADGMKASSVASHHRVWRTFARFCAEEGWLNRQSTVFQAAGPKLPQLPVEVITASQEARLIKAARCPRDAFLIRFMVRTGVRLTECCSLTLRDIPEGERVILIRQGKGRKPRAVPLDTRACRFSDELDRYIRRIRPQSPSDALFLTLTKVSGDHHPLRPHGLYIMLRRLGEETGIHVHPHLFRHTFASRSLAAGLNPIYLQRALGHTTLAMTQRYVHHSQADLIEAWQQRRD